MKTSERISLSVFALSLALWLISCAGGSAAQNPPPSVASIAPASAMAGGAAFTLTVNGSNFISTSVVRWNGSGRSTTFVSSTELTVAISAADIANAGTANITVYNPDPGGGASNGATFSINNPAPAISGLNPANATAGGPAFTLTVDGSNFVSSSVVQWNGSNRTTTFVSSSRLTAAIPSSDTASAGVAQVSVSNPGPGGGPSNAMSFTVTSPTPVITSLSPSQIMSSSATFPLTVNGSGFVQGSVVRWNGFDRSTTFVNSTQLTAAIPAADIASTGTAQVTVFNPAPGGGSSSALSFYVAPEGVGVIERVSVDNNGAQLEGNSWVYFAGVSGDGRFVAFASYCVSCPNPANHVFVRDTCRGAPAGCTPSTVQASVANDDSPGNGTNADAAISADGRFVAFSSYSSNLVPDDTNSFTDVILRDTCAGAAAGCAPSTTRASVASDGMQGDGPSQYPTISADGRFVAFYSQATNLVPNDTNGEGDAFVRDTCFGAPAGCVPSTIRVSVANDDSQGNNGGGIPWISGNGRFVVFDSGATNLVAGDTNGFWDAFVRDTCVGAPTGCTPSTTRVSVANDGSQAIEGGGYGGISTDGRFVTILTSDASNLVPGDTNGFWDVFVRDTCVGAPAGCTPCTTLVSVANDGTQGNADSAVEGWAPISGDGRFVAFPTWATNLLPEGNRQGDFLVRDTCVGAPAGCTPRTVRVNVASDGSDGSPSLYPASSQVAISADGRFVAFESDVNDLVPGDTNCPDPEFPGTGCFDVFLARTGGVAAPVAASNAWSDASVGIAHLPPLKKGIGTRSSGWSKAEGALAQPSAPSLMRQRRRPSGRSLIGKMGTKEEKP